jgi:hypothetical protein
MPKISLPYTSFPIAASAAHPEGTLAYRPLAIATITASNGNSLQSIVLPDTGADACLFPMSVAIMLKLDVLQLPKDMTEGVGSQANLTYYDHLTIDMGHGIMFTTYAGFTQGMDSVGLGLLGQRGFFDAYNVEFRHCDKVFVIELP